MPLPLSRVRLVMLTALSSALLTACASGPAAPRPIGPAADPVIETRTVERKVCPVELRQDVGAQPQPADDAVLRHNDPGGDYLDAIIAWGRRAASLFNDAKAQCPQE